MAAITLNPAAPRPLFFLFFFLLVLFLSNSSGSAQAQAQLPKSTIDGTPLLTDSSFWRNNEALQLPPRPHLLRSAAYVAAGVAAWTVTFALVDEPLQQFTQKHQSAVAGAVSDVMQPLGRQRNLAPLLGATLLGGLVLNDQKLQKVGILSLGSIVVNSLATSALKSSAGRHRPSVTTENHIFDEPFSNSHNTSLPSSHTSTAFAVATSVATVYKDNKIVPPLAYGVATLVGLSRINDNMHWASDVLAGAAVGYLSAKAVNRIYDMASQRSRARRQRLYFAPNVGSSSATMSMTLVF